MSTATRQECLANPIAMLEPVAETLA
jgi:hypothetical protein